MTIAATHRRIGSACFGTQQANCHSSFGPMGNEANTLAQHSACYEGLIPVHVVHRRVCSIPLGRTRCYKAACADNKIGWDYCKAAFT